MRLGVRGVAAVLGVVTFDLVNGSIAPAKVDECQGYSVSNVVEEPFKVQADLDLIGQGCSVYGPDVAQLKLLVEYQTSLWNARRVGASADFAPRLTHTCPHPGPRWRSVSSPRACIPSPDI